MHDLLFIDTETTGTDTNDRLLQVAYRSGETTVNELFKPPTAIDLVAMSIHHITEAMVAGKPSFLGSLAYHDLLAKRDNHIFVAHNAPFDLAMLAKEGVVFDTYICTYKVAYWLHDNAMVKHNLQYLRYYYNLAIDLGELSPHDALADIIVLEAVFHELAKHVAVKAGIDGDAVIDKMIAISSQPLLHDRFLFGKHDYRRTGMTIEDIVTKLPHKEGRGYLMWLLEQKMAEPEDQRDENWIYTLNYWLSK